MITIEDIDLAHQRIKPYIHHTPVLTSKTLNEIFGCSLYLKCENFQKIGAFKIRGAMNTALQLSENEIKNGLATHSSGNHAQAIAYSAKALNTIAYIVMPENSAKVKVNAVKNYGAKITFCEPNLQAREDTLNEVIRKTNAYFIHPYEDERIIKGQATCAKELLEEINDINILIAPVGGGGLLAGTSLSAEYYGNNCEVFAGEPEGACDTELSIRNGKVTKAPYIKTIADGLLTTIGQLNFEIVKERVKKVITVSDDEIINSLRLIYERMKIIIEPSSAVPIAALYKMKDVINGKKVGIIISGGNVDINSLKDWFS